MFTILSVLVLDNDVSPVVVVACRSVHGYRGAQQDIEEPEPGNSRRRRLEGARAPEAEPGRLRATLAGCATGKGEKPPHAERCGGEL